MSKWKSLLFVACLIILVTLIYNSWLSRQLLPYGENPFTKNVNFHQINQDGSGEVLLGETITIQSNKGVYAKIEFSPSAEPPELYHDVKVQHPDRWPLTLAIFRPHKTRKKDVVELNCQTTHNFIAEIDYKNRHKMPPPRLPGIGTSALRTKNVGYLGVPTVAPTVEGSSLYWTFISPTNVDDPEGEFVYEIRLYPTAHWISAMRGKRGVPVVLKRGRLVVESPT